MRAILQRVDSAEIRIEGRETKAIGPGLLVFLGVMEGDEAAQAEYLAGKICGLRIFKDENDRLNRSLKDFAGDMLVVSNFTLSADCRHGKRPSFDRAAKQDKAEALYDQFVSLVRAEDGLGKIETGVFGAHMHITAENDGPVNLILDTDVKR